MFDVGGGELVLIVLAVLVLFGPKKIPEIAQMFGKGIQKVKQAQNEFKNQMNDIQNDINSAVNTPTKNSVHSNPKAPSDITSDESNAVKDNNTESTNKTS